MLPLIVNKDLISGYRKLATIGLSLDWELAVITPTLCSAANERVLDIL